MIPHARSKEKDDFLNEREQSVMRSELVKLMRLARIDRPDAIYDASAAAQNFANFKPGGCNEERLLMRRMKRKVIKRRFLSRLISNICQGLKIFC